MPALKKPRYTEHKESIINAISTAMGEFTSLGEEMRSWADNMEEKLSHTEKFERVSEAADNLEGINEPDVPSSLQEREVVYHLSTKRKQSRADRRDDATGILAAIVSDLEEIIDDDEAAQSLKDEAEMLCDEIQNIIDEAEGVEFPGMYG